MHSGTLVLDHTIVADQHGAQYRPRSDRVAGRHDQRAVQPDRHERGQRPGGDTGRTRPMPRAIYRMSHPWSLAPLADNGGPTKTHALAASSPARNAGDPGRGRRRGHGAPSSISAADRTCASFGGRIDIGAYERQSVPNPSLGRRHAWPMKPTATIRPAICRSARRSGWPTATSIRRQTITFAPALTAGGPATIHLDPRRIGESTTRSRSSGPGRICSRSTPARATPRRSQQLRRQPGVQHRRRQLRTLDKTVSISGLTLTGGDAIFDGGGIFSAET